MLQFEETLKTVADAIGRAVGRDLPSPLAVPSREKVTSIPDDVLSILFPVFRTSEGTEGKSRETVLSDLFFTIKSQIGAAFALEGSAVLRDTETLACEILAALPGIREALVKDVEALYEGDPAAKGREEVLLSYPGFYAVAVYRVAHEFYKRGIPYLSRMMTEHAHSLTGIDIHAGAEIGEYFFIDHGTGIVIGETTVIGDHVKLYQGVTLGAKSFELDADGNPVKGIKRHPNIGNHVIVYANATILGGKTTIGDHSVIGANVWITHSVAPGTTVSYNEK